MQGDSRHFLCGVDVGSTTVKVAILAGNGSAVPSIEEPVFSEYVRHNTHVWDSVRTVLTRAASLLNGAELRLSVTGSAGMGISERLGVPFVQEVVAAADMVRALFPDARAICDIGGEDSKLVLFDERGRSDIRMNGSCAGGTGSFIDQMATLMRVPIADFNALAERAESSYPIASRCGVFAKTDVQNLLSQGVSNADIAASVLDAVALQTVNALARGFEAKPRIVLSGGPLTFMPYLRRSLLKALGLTENDALVLNRAELLSALGAAFASTGGESATTADQLLSAMEARKTVSIAPAPRERRLFETSEELDEWTRGRFTALPRVPLAGTDGLPCTIGIDSGSTTTKLILMDDQGRIAFDFYTFNRGDHVGSVREGLTRLAGELEECGAKPSIVGTAVTGYGEDLIRVAFGLDYGVVETLAHFRSARQLAPDVDFVLDIGGQDMKAMFIEDGVVSRIEINEACSSGCGSFVQTFAEVLGIDVAEFAAKACDSQAPCSLGSRCTVFMNSKVKQFLREGAAVEDLAAGLAYSVVRNCLTKVLKVRDMDQLGRTVVVQGGTFLNPAVHRAFEQLTGKRVVCPDLAGLTGAYGCALLALDSASENSKPFDLAEAIVERVCEKRKLVCHGCVNRCTVTRMKFENGRTFYSGNRCERIFSNSGAETEAGTDLSEFREELLLGRPTRPEGEPIARIGLPRVLNVFENYPFWSALLVDLGFEVVLSEPSSPSLYQKGAGTIMSDSICFPAKLVHGHIADLAERGVDRILYPQVVYEEHGFGALNSYNCPIVSGYPDVIRSSMDPERRYGIPFDSPVITFNDKALLRSACRSLAQMLGAPVERVGPALEHALAEQRAFREALVRTGEEVVAQAGREGRRVALLLERPYHADRLINHGVPRMLADMGMDVLPTDFAPDQGTLEGLQVLTQWAYPNRLYNAARFAARHEHVEAVQLNSFGCGPDALATDELTDLLAEHGKHLTVIRIDETASPGSIRLRLRTMAETLRLRAEKPGHGGKERVRAAVFMPCDRGRKILVPNFSPVLSSVVESEFGAVGYDFEVLPPADADSEAYGLKYVNNEVCYPAIMTIGDILKALDSGKYDLNEVAVGITQTGGQCRASSYLSLLGKALVSAGYGNVPMVGIHLTSKSLHHQPGFVLDKKRLVKRAILSIVVSDAVAMMERALRVREEVPGAAAALGKRLMAEWTSSEERTPRAATRFLRYAVEQFNAIPARAVVLPRIGIVGEIYVKYGAFSNRFVGDWLADRGVDVVIPHLANFFLQELRNTQYKTEIGLLRKSLWSRLTPALQYIADGFIERVNDVLRGFPYATLFPDIRQMADDASEVLDLVNQFGEGWLIAGEITHLARHGVENILCLQPFGCIANQVVAKGVETRLRRLHPEISVLFVDLDHNTSEANMFNRIHFLVKNARAAVETR